jgi:hypothetical protein
MQIWLRKSVKATTLQLFGRLEEYSKKPGDPFHLPCLRIVGAASQWTRLQLSADSNVILLPGPLQNLWQVPALRASSRERNYVTQQSSYGATLQVKPALATHDVRALTLAQTHGRELSFTSTLDFNLRRGESRTVTVRLRNWPGSQLRLQAPRMSVRRENQPDAATHVWSLELQPGVTGPYALTLSGVVSLDATPEILMPDVSVDEAPEAERLLVTAGSDLVVDDTRGLVALADTAQALERWPNARAQVSQTGGSAWKVVAEDWKLRLRPNLTRVAAKPVRIFHEEFAAAVRDGQHWEYQAAYWLYQEAGADLHVLLPRAGHLVRALIDRKEVMPLKSEPGRVVLPLAGGNGVHSLRLSWAIVDETMERPSFTRPRLQDAAGAAIPVEKHAEAATLQPVRGAKQNPTPQGAKDVALWRIQLPAGYQAIQEHGEAENAAAQDLNRVAALLDLCGHLAERSKETGDAASAQELAAAEQQFYRACRHAQYRLALAGHGRQVPARSALLSTLLQNNKQLAEASHFEKTRADAENIAALHPLSADTAGEEPVSLLATGGARDCQDLSGTPTYWLLPEGAAGQALRFTPLRLQQLRRAFALSSVVVMLCLIAWLVTYSPRLVSAARFLWPEQIALVGFIGWQSAGFHAVFALLIFFALSARLVYVGSWLSDLLNRWTSRSAPSASG